MNYISALINITQFNENINALKLKTKVILFQAVKIT